MVVIDQHQLDAMCSVCWGGTQAKEATILEALQGVQIGTIYNEVRAADVGMELLRLTRHERADFAQALHKYMSQLCTGFKGYESRYSLCETWCLD